MSTLSLIQLVFLFLGIAFIVYMFYRVFVDMGCFDDLEKQCDSEQRKAEFRRINKLLNEHYDKQG